MTTTYGRRGVCTWSAEQDRVYKLFGQFVIFSPSHAKLKMANRVFCTKFACTFYSAFLTLHKQNYFLTSRANLPFILTWLDGIIYGEAPLFPSFSQAFHLHGKIFLAAGSSNKGLNFGSRQSLHFALGSSKVSIWVKTRKQVQSAQRNARIGCSVDLG